MWRSHLRGWPGKLAIAQMSFGTLNWSFSWRGNLSRCETGHHHKAQRKGEDATLGLSSPMIRSPGSCLSLTLLHSMDGKSSTQMTQLPSTRRSSLLLPCLQDGKRKWTI